MSSFFQRAATFGILPCAVLLAGCSGGDGLPRKSVSGAVTLGGQPLATGSIQYIPDDLEKGTPASGEIAGGKFTIPPERGPVPGQYRVVISGGASTPVAADAAPGASPPPARDPVPARYNAATTLVAEIKADGANTFDYALDAK
jgi:hypothetical protein